ncbi:N-6 DNA Methylase [Symmachiella dynata]|uniref:site-specific DNA-methyltransferase (adenine-specific) n=1 Tax=Symmachiella dynata TaxID=2527995 RepID=A0A517ZGX9_9PLAN|nr:N-6 DNA methylase [Symmachiella dynata]QDU41712.1 N-6 DNA Methylase [Symmachiella dynata]
MKKFAPYVLKLANLVEQSSDRRRSYHQKSIAPALDGEPSRVLRDLVDLETRREHGAFFSGSELGKSLRKRWAQQISPHSVICDPACGSGDLLLAITTLLPIKEGLRETLDAWGTNLYGVDIHKEFVDSTKYRLALQAIALGATRERINRDDVLKYFPGVRLGNGLEASEELAKATHVVTNPPFSPTQATKDCTWTRGLVNSAALFMESISKHATSGARIWAILPDVLRSGTRYDKWRKLIASRLRDIRVTPIGQFSRHADVDVFVVEGIVRARSNRNVGECSSFLVEKPQDASQILGELFTVNVGSVVPHRHPDEGEQAPYLTPHNCPAWKQVTTIDDFRGFRGRLFKPPLVVLRRTSRSDDSYRAIGTLVTGKRAVAIENHLLVLTPNSRMIADCKRLLQVLKSQATNDWLNRRICCRHLTVSAVKSIPWNLETK